MKKKRKLGKVWLVGAGPGDPGLVTCKGRDFLLRADVVLHDALIHPGVLRFAGRARLVGVGKRAGGKATPQEVTNRLMIQYARAGLRVVRLKGGDPFMFGRGGEECEALAKAGIPYEVVPGVSSALAGPAAAGIPLTHRNVAASVTIVTGRTTGDANRPDVDWVRLARSSDTLVIMMGTWEIAEIAHRLISAGRDPNTPATAVRWATWPMQEVARATLATAAARFSSLKPPTVIVVGTVAGMGAQSRTARGCLTGIRIATTREWGVGHALAIELERHGALVHQCPAIATVWLIDAPAYRRAIARVMSDIGTYDLVVFTSVNAVATFMTALKAHHLDGRSLAHMKIAAIGAATADDLGTLYELRPDIVPKTAVSEELAKSLGRVEGKRILIPRALEAREVLPRDLSRRGASVTVLPLYRTAPDPAGVQRLKNLVREEGIDVVTFTSGSTVDHSMRALGSAGRRQFKKSVMAASIGPVTSAALRKWGIRPAMQAKQASMAGLAAAIVSYYRKHPHGH
jgi:uroporphyrinogen III methyltransferase/synthase